VAHEDFRTCNHICAGQQRLQGVARSLSASGLPQIVAQLRAWGVGPQAACTSYSQPVPCVCWSKKLCVEEDVPFALTRSGVFEQAFDIFCSCLLTNSVDVLCALLPEVTDISTLLHARPSVHDLLQKFFR
jgi:hypothetical protein